MVNYDDWNVLKKKGASIHPDYTGENKSFNFLSVWVSSIALSHSQDRGIWGRFHWNDWLMLSTANGVRGEVIFSLKGTAYVWREVLVAPQLVDRSHCLPVFSHHYRRWIMIDWPTNKGWPKIYIITFGGLKRPAWGKNLYFVPNGPKGFCDFT